MLIQFTPRLLVPPAEKPKKLLEQVRDVIRAKHYSIRTEETYVNWIKRYILFHDKRHPLNMGANEVKAFLTDLAVNKNVSSKTQNQALNALVFLYKHVLKVELGELKNIPRAQDNKRIPTVMTVSEVQRVLKALTGTYWLMGAILYGSGLRLMELLRLRVKDIDFEKNVLSVRDGKGMKDRVTMLPEQVKGLLTQHLERIKLIHQSDLKAGHGRVHLPTALAAKYPNLDKEWGWQYVFPASTVSKDPRTGKTGRHHIHETALQKTIHKAVRLAGITKHVGPHTFRHSFAYVASLVMWCLCRCSCRVLDFVVKGMSFIPADAPKKFMPVVAMS